ncbi:josephin-2-like [Artemia franciscana]|uniref:ubiquitinyl hydrolase 1 n=1 Tax=Artemia franciscana TaxID=6661 RepID=A0AA88LGP8_ARTSF|nr:hypothetical protein QYM36_004757 [Artemia franciscana]
MYHEKQSKQLCLLHSLNNLYQKEVFQQKVLDGICSVLSPDTFFSPHRSILGLGNYDVNVMMKAVQVMGHEAVWFDKRLHPSVLVLKHVVGIILNMTTSSYIPPFHRKHWIAIREVGGKFYNFDSKLKGPIEIGDESHLKSFLVEKLKTNEVEMFIVVEEDTHKSGSWKNS